MKSDEPPRFEVSPTAARILSIDNQIAALDRVKPKPHVLLFGSVVFPLGVIAVATASVALDLPSLRGWVVLLAVPCILYARQFARNNVRRARLEQELDRLIENPVSQTSLPAPDHPS